MAPEEEIRPQVQVAVRRALGLEAATRISRGLYEASMSARSPDSRRKPQNSQKPYHLVENEAAFLRTGELSGSYRNRPDKLHSRIEDKAGQLPDRLALLFEDVSLLAHPPFSDREAGFDAADGGEGGYFTAEQWGDAWLDLMEIHPEEDLGDVFSSRSIYSHNPAGRFGRKLGELWAAVMLYPVDVPPQRLWIDAIQGFIDGLYLDNPRFGRSERPQARREFIETLADEVETWGMERIDAAAQSEQEWFDQRRERNQVERRIREELSEMLEEEGIDPMYVLNYVQFEFAEPLRRGSRGSDQGDAEITPKALRAFIEGEQLQAKAAILAELDDDAQAIREKTGRGPAPTAILEAIYRSEGASSLEIARECTRREHQASVTETARDMAGEREPADRPGKVWVDRPLLAGDPSGWTLTDYGRLLAEHLFDGHHGLGVRELTEAHVERLAPTVGE